MTCPHCRQRVNAQHGRYNYHLHNGTECLLVRRCVPATGDTPTDYERRAHVLCDLAQLVRDEDPAITLAYVNALPAAELRRLLIAAVAAIPIDQTIRETWRWVTELPAARKAS